MSRRASGRRNGRVDSEDATKGRKGERIERVDSADATKEKMNSREKRRLLKYEELPEFLKDNEFILDYYRCEWPLKDTFLSVFSLHNETLNIWTHLGGFVIFAAMAVLSLMENTNDDDEGSISSFFRTNVVATPLMTILSLHSTNSSKNSAPTDSHYIHYSRSSLLGINRADSELLPRWPWFVFLSGAMCCLVFSSLSHLLACHSKRLNLFFWRLDYTGISIMIVCSFFAPVYYVFYCQPIWQLLYLTSITIFGILSIITLLAPALSSPRFRKFRASLFLTMGFSGVIPAIHAATLHWAHSQMLIALGYEVFMGMLYAIGAGFYVSRIPERWKPGCFDLAGHSHQIFHVFVVGGALAHSVATLIMMNWRQGSLTC
ncbi:hypothetical protein RND81_07G079100 [Saponaria officinalis]|uniref:Heptahelical transmembrane protein 2 n=1 Tax=Saponaria officinalis TaxID=3572 RepID=A0AAW1JNC2_SAPOF